MYSCTCRPEQLSLSRHLEPLLKSKGPWNLKKKMQKFAKKLVDLTSLAMPFEDDERQLAEWVCF